MQETGCGAVKLEGGGRMADTIGFLTGRGIPVRAHIGLAPQSIHTLGSFRAQGRNEAAQWMECVNGAGAIEEDGGAVSGGGAPRRSAPRPPGGGRPRAQAPAAEGVGGQDGAGGGGARGAIEEDVPADAPGGCHGASDDVGDGRVDTDAGHVG